MGLDLAGAKAPEEKTGAFDTFVRSIVVCMAWRLAGRENKQGAVQYIAVVHGVLYVLQPYLRTCISADFYLPTT